MSKHRVIAVGRLDYQKDLIVLFRHGKLYRILKNIVIGNLIFLVRANGMICCSK